MIKREQVEQILFDMYIPFTGRFERYLIETIMYVDDNGGLPIKWMGAYCTIGKKYNVSPSAVERSIRRGICNARALSPNQKLVARYFGEDDLGVAASIGRFYAVFKSDNADESKEGDEEMTDDMLLSRNLCLKKLNEIDANLKRITDAIASNPNAICERKEN